MSQQLQNVISRLYKPPIDGTRQVFALSRADAERLPTLSSVAVISITSPERARAALDASTKVLRLSFADVDFLNPDLSQRAREKLGHAFTDEHADAIRSFVEALPAEIASVVVHCEGGYSRSCGVALALHRLYGYRAELQHLSQANPSIVRVMMGTASSGTQPKSARKR